MMKREVLAAWEGRAIRAQTKIQEELEPELEQFSYEKEIAQRLLAKAPDESARQAWQPQIDVIEMMITMTDTNLAEQQEELTLCEAMISEIEADLAEDRTE